MARAYHSGALVYPHPSRADQRPAVGFDEMDAHHPPQCWKLSKPAALLTASHPALPILDSSGSEFEGRV